ncbi:MAG TPA: NAD(P)-dependent oxidoreductase [Hyphomicrobiaceae bacterium]|nr:NAD(P)-dependent oxidoreductase [Hyphomicrobiaceae bacterium]
MPRIAVTTPYFEFFPELKAELAAAYPGTKFRTERRPLAEDELIEYVAGYDTAVIGLDRFSDRVCAALPELKVISLCSAGVDHIDPTILRKHGKRMWWAAGINKVSVSELAVCYMVLAVRRLHFFSRVLARGAWTGPIGFGTDLRGRTVGIHGCGHIGKEVVKLLQPYGVKILACDRVDYSDFYRQYGVEKVDADELWARSDVLTIHLSRNTTTVGMYSADVLDRMKPGAVLVNCARGGMVDEVALKARLESGHIAGAAFDVFAVEPANGNPLLEVPNFFGSPHIGATTRESWEAMLRSGIRGIDDAYEPQPGVYPFD